MFYTQKIPKSSISLTVIDDAHIPPDIEYMNPALIFHQIMAHIFHQIMYEFGFTPSMRSKAFSVTQSKMMQKLIQTYLLGGVKHKRFHDLLGIIAKFHF